MKWLLCIGTVACLIGGAGCYDSDSRRTAYQRALQDDEKRREAAWAESDRLNQEDQKRREAAWAESERSNEVYSNMQARSLKLLESEETLQPRWDALLKKQEEQAVRFDALLTKWERMALPPSK